jgi:hypothetical protein
LCACTRRHEPSLGDHDVKTLLCAHVKIVA